MAVKSSGSAIRDGFDDNTVFPIKDSWIFMVAFRKMLYRMFMNVRLESSVLCVVYQHSGDFCAFVHHLYCETYRPRYTLKPRQSTTGYRGPTRGFRVTAGSEPAFSFWNQKMFLAKKLPRMVGMLDFH